MNMHYYGVHTLCVPQIDVFLNNLEERPLTRISTPHYFERNVTLIVIALVDIFSTIVF